MDVEYVLRYSIRFIKGGIELLETDSKQHSMPVVNLVILKSTWAIITAISSFG